MYVQNQKYITKSIVSLQDWHQNMQNYKSLFQQIFIVYKTFRVGKKLKICQDQPDLIFGHFIKVFYKTTTCPRRSLLIGEWSSYTGLTVE